MIISPVSVTVGIALNYSGLSWAGIAVPVFVLSLLGLASAFFEPARRNSGKKQLLSPANYETEPSAIPLKSYLPFLLLFAGVASPILYLENILHFSSLNSISLGCLLPLCLDCQRKISSQVFSRSMVFLVRMSGIFLTRFSFYFSGIYNAYNGTKRRAGTARQFNKRSRGKDRAPYNSSSWFL